MMKVTLYTRQGCSLCEQVVADLAALQAVVPHELEQVDVDSSPSLAQELGQSIPVVAAGPYRLEAPFTRQDLQITLQAAQEGLRQEAQIDADIASGKLKIPERWTRADAFSHWWARHYLAVCNLIVFLYVGLPFLAPVLEHLGQPWLADRIYDGYSFVCHQYAYRSWFLFGEQPFYPRQAAGLAGFRTYEEVTGLHPFDDWSARAFKGNPQLGYKVALCQRDVAIYLGILAFGVVFALSGRRLKSFKWYYWVLIGIVPIGLDGGSQLVLQIFQRLGWLEFARESTPFLRVLTGFLFGVTTSWFGYPLVEETMRESLAYFDSKLARLREQGETAATELS